MKNHVKGFSQFINERAKGDYFQGGPKNPEIYGLHKRGSGDWHNPGEEDWNRITGEDPDEELSNQEFIDKYGEELDKAGHNFINQQPSDNRVKVWKNRNEPEPDTSLLPKRSLSHLQPKQIREFITLLQRGMEKGEYLINRENSVAMIAHLKSELKGR